LVACSSDNDVTVVGDQPDDKTLTALGRGALALATPCEYDAEPTRRLLTVRLARGEAAVLSNVGGFVLVNDAQCTTPVPAAEVARVSIAGASGDESVRLDFSGGPFAFPTEATDGLGIAVDLGGGDDTLEIVLGASDDRVTLGAGGLSIVTPAAPQSDPFKDVTPSGVERLTLHLGDGNDTYSGGGSVVPDLGGPFIPVLSLAIDGGGGDDTFVQSPLETPAEAISGGDGRDVVAYSARLAAVSVSLSARADVAGGAPSGANVDAGAPDVEPDGGTPASAIVDGGGVSGDAGVPRAIAGDDGAPTEGDDIRDDVEVVVGGAGDDLLTGGDNGDLLLGGNGDDTLAGGLGDDTLIGGNGLDLFVEGSAPNGADVFNGGAGLDTIDYSGRVAPIAVSMDGTSANDGDTLGEGDSVSADVENVLGGSGNDVLTGNPSNNVISGGPGDDVITGGAGHDTLSYASSSSGVTATLPDPALGTPSTGNGAAGENDRIDASIENLTGSAHDDQLTGNRGANELAGGAGNDTLLGGAGDDILEGGPPANTESNRLECGAGDDIAFAEGTGAGATTRDCEL
jgi:Ca2+-binding RTX toxin-like protein